MSIELNPPVIPVTIAELVKKKAHAFVIISGKDSYSELSGNLYTNNEGKSVSLQNEHSGKLSFNPNHITSIEPSCISGWRISVVTP